MLATRDENLGAVERIASIGQGRGTGACQTQIAAGVRFGQAHGGQPLAGGHFAEVLRFELIAGVVLDALIGAVQQARCHRPAVVGATQHLVEHGLQHAGQTLAAVLGGRRGHEHRGSSQAITARTTTGVARPTRTSDQRRRRRRAFICALLCDPGLTWTEARVHRAFVARAGQKREPCFFSSAGFFARVFGAGAPIGHAREIFEKEIIMAGAGEGSALSTVSICSA